MNRNFRRYIKFYLILYLYIFDVPLIFSKLRNKIYWWSSIQFNLAADIFDVYFRHDSGIKLGRGPKNIREFKISPIDTHVQYIYMYLYIYI